MVSVNDGTARVDTGDLGYFNVDLGSAVDNVSKSLNTDRVKQIPWVQSLADMTSGVFYQDTQKPEKSRVLSIEEYQRLIKSGRVGEALTRPGVKVGGVGVTPLQLLIIGGIVAGVFLL